MADQTATIEHARAMLDHLRGLSPGVSHELARAMLGAATTYLVEVFGHQHAVQVASDLLRPILDVTGPEAAPDAPIGDAPPAEPPAATLH